MNKNNLYIYLPIYGVVHINLMVSYYVITFNQPELLEENGQGLEEDL
jgi:hypothetical protein